MNVDRIQLSALGQLSGTRKWVLDLGDEIQYHDDIDDLAKAVRSEFGELAVIVNDRGRWLAMVRGDIEGCTIRRTR